MDNTDPFDILLEIERGCQENASGLPASNIAEQEWVGVSFRIGDSKLIAAMDEVKEIMDLPDTTQVPGVKSWVVGVANVRGSVLPIMDMKGFLLGEDIKQRRKGRVIVIDYKGFDTGLIVEEVYGMRHFQMKDKTSDLPALNGNVTQFIDDAFKNESEYWPVFSFTQMTNDKRFAQASM